MGTEIRPVILGQFGPPTLACIRSWGKQGLSVGMICIKSKGESDPKSKYLTDFITLLPGELYTEEGIQIIREFLIKYRATGITCITESISCWVNENRQMLPNEVTLWIPSSQTIHELLSKQKQIDVACRVGFDVLPTYLIDKNSETIDHIAKDHFPLCLRPDDPATVTPVFKAHLVHSHEELIEYVKSMQKIGSPIVAQPFMHLPNLVVHGARTVNGDSIGLQGFLVERKFEGLTLTIRPTQLEKDFLDKCIDFTSHFNVTGNYHFEFLVDKKNGSTYFLELNNRLGGTTAKVYACGYDEPLLVLQSYGILPTSPETGNQKPASSNQQIKNKTVSSKQFLLKYLYYTIKGRLTPLDYPSEPKWKRILKTIYGILKYKDDVFTFRDIKGSMALYFGNLKSNLP